MTRTLTTTEKVEAARRLREDWVSLGVQISRLTEQRNNILRDAQQLERQAEAEGYTWGRSPTTA